MRRGALACLALLASALLADQGRAADEVAPPKAKPTLTFSSNRFGPFELLNVGVDGKDPERLVREGEARIAAQEPVWSSGGKRVVFASSEKGPSQIYLMDPRGHGLRALTDTVATENKPACSPDGRKIAFCSSRDGNEEVYLMDADGTNQVNLTKHPGRDTDPTWTPDGKSIIFATDRKGQFRLCAMNADGTEPREIVHRDLFGWIYPSVSPDGKTLAHGGVAPDNTYQLFLSGPDGENPRQLTKGGQINSYASWSPDGRHLAYVRFDEFPQGFRQGNPFDPTEAGGDLMIYDVEAGTHAKISAGDLPLWGPRPCWRPDPRAKVVAP